MCGKCKNTNCGNDCQSVDQPKSVCDLTPSGDVYYDGVDLVIGETTIATKGDNLNDVLSNIATELNNLQP